MLTAKLCTVPSALTVLLFAVLATPAPAETSARNSERLQVADQLADFKQFGI
jgi:hypothetical protein